MVTASGIQEVDAPEVGPSLLFWGLRGNQVAGKCFLTRVLFPWVESFSIPFNHRSFQAPAVFPGFAEGF